MVTNYHLSDYHYSVIKTIPHPYTCLQLDSIGSANLTIILCVYPKKFNNLGVSEQGEYMIFCQDFLENVDLIIAVPERNFNKINKLSH